MNFVKFPAVLFISVLTTALVFTRAQNLNIENYQYLSPVPGSKLNSTETNIIIKTGDVFDNSILDEPSLLIVSGSKSGVHSGEIILAEEGRTIIFKPYNRFADGENVTVEITKKIFPASGRQISPLRYSFEISEVNLNKLAGSDPLKYFKMLNLDLSPRNNSAVTNKNPHKTLEKRSYTIQLDKLPEDFPEAFIDSINNPAPGSIFYTPFKFPGFLGTYLIITDYFGVPVFYRKINTATFDFKKLTNGTLAYYDTGTNKYYIMDSSYSIIDSLAMQNGYLTDLHELIVFENNHAFLMSYDPQQVAMDTVVPGGDPNATVIGIILQELDENKNVVFQWRSWDHYQIADATFDINLTGSTVDYAHSNSIEIDYDGHILLSTRHFDEVTKINRQTGNIIWRLGGEFCENNQFTFLNDPIGFSHQHDARRLPNGNITIYDNGNLHSPQFTRIVEYQLDEVNKYATLVWEYKNDPATYSNAMGSSRRLSNHNTFVGWGTTTTPAISEVNAEGNVTFYLSHPDTFFNYRAFKFPWKTNYFVTKPDSLFFGFVPEGDSLTLNLEIKNNSNGEIEINGLLNRDSAFYVNTPLPIIISPQGTANMQVTFKPPLNGNYSDDLHLQWNRETERISQVVKMSGTTITSVGGYPDELTYSLKQNYPNPFNPVTKINFTIPEEGDVVLEVFDILGRRIKSLLNERITKGSYNINFEADDLPSGVYIYILKVNDYIASNKMMLLR